MEQNGPPATASTETGYGSILLTKVLPAQADALSSLNFDASGLTFHLEAPLAHLG
jgi:hypothetical protein